MVLVFPCSGIGKSLGTVTRQAAFEVCEDLKPETARMGALALLVMGDEDSRRVAANSDCVSIDGCNLACATKMVQECNGKIIQSVSVLDAVKKYREFKPSGIAELNEGGLKLAHAVAMDIAAALDRYSEKEAPDA
jgi:uncharacterized metal-binding protein